MQGEFNNNPKDIKIQVTEIGASEKRELRAVQIESFKATENGQTKIIYRLEEGGTQLEEITVTEDSESVAKALNGEPSSDEVSEMNRDVEIEVKQQAESDLGELERKYTKDKEALEASQQSEVDAKQAEIDTKEEELKNLQSDIRSSFRGRWADNLHSKIEHSSRYHYGHESPRNKRRRLVFKIITIGGLADKIIVMDKIARDHDSMKQGMKQMQQSQAGDRINKEQAFGRERERLVRLRDDPAMSQEARGRLEAKIRNYRVEHGDDHNFNFVRQIGGGYENEQTPERKAQRAEQRQDLSEGGWRALARGRRDRDFEHGR